jgi:hypothetical protein
MEGPNSTGRSSDVERLTVAFSALKQIKANNKLALHFFDRFSTRYF